MKRIFNILLLIIILFDIAYTIQKANLKLNRDDKSFTAKINEQLPPKIAVTNSDRLGVKQEGQMASYASSGTRLLKKDPMLTVSFIYFTHSIRNFDLQSM